MGFSMTLVTPRTLIYHKWPPRRQSDRCCRSLPCSCHILLQNPSLPAETSSRSRHGLSNSFMTFCFILTPSVFNSCCIYFPCSDSWLPCFTYCVATSATHCMSSHYLMDLWYLFCCPFTSQFHFIGLSSISLSSLQLGSYVGRCWLKYSFAGHNAHWIFPLLEFMLSCIIVCSLGSMANNVEDYWRLLKIVGWSTYASCSLDKYWKLFLCFKIIVILQ